ncbi:MAG TPA: hypothetical protein DD429_00150 [Clostridiaceae bacterium]|jgi:membrane protease YdiL (CAAX protease family)|nr:hypothetical protein [Clostridiaceae bacterium]
MNGIIKYAGDLLVIMLVAFPPFLYLYRYLYDKIKNVFLRIALYAVYWAGTLYFSNVLPAASVLFLIYRSRKESIYHRNDEEGEDSRQRKFNLDCTGWRWKFSIKNFIKIALWGIPIKYAVTYINLLFIEVLSKLKITLTNQEVVNQFLKSDVFQSIVLSMLVVVCAPIVEEFVFRFWLYDRLLKNRIGTFFAAILTSLLFMAAHFNVQGAVTFFLIGIINCFIYDRYGYWGAVANHFMFNFTSAILLILIKFLNIPV